jgi:alpha-L-rhamnosidase
MNIKQQSALLCLLLAAHCGLAKPAGPFDLRCEYFDSPMGIEARAPRLFWKLAPETRGSAQTACRILVASRAELLDRDQGDLWDSGRLNTAQATFLPYAGGALASGRQCFWKVRIWDQKGRASAWSTNAVWAMGKLSAEDWRGGWIASDLQLMEYQKNLRALPDFGMESEHELWGITAKIREMTAGVSNAPAAWLRKEFDLGGRVRRATASLSGLGLFEMFLNGKRISDHQLDPAQTDYAKRVFYLAHDVTDALRQGRNAIGVVLGNGWFNLITPHTLRYHAADYIAPPRLLLNLDIEFEDGSRQRVATDETWKSTTDGPIRYNCILGGETFDARKDMPGWAAPGFDDAAWKQAGAVAAPEGRLTSQQLRPVRKVAELPAVKLTRGGDTWRFDLGVETVGRPRLRVKGRPGQEITIYMPGADSHTLGRYQTCKYIFKGRDWEFFEPRFCYAGYQFVEVTGLDYEPSLSDCAGQVVCSDLESAGEFACSDERLNKLQEILVRTIRNYIVHIPNDPTREKAGWTQDIESGFPETVLNFDSAAMYVKWQRDFLDSIKTNGYMPPVSPGRFDGPTINGPWWGGVVIYAPWWIYEFYGDREILAESYPAMKAQLAYLGGIASNNIVRWGLGDWMEVGSVRPVRTPVPLTSTCAYYWFARILEQTARLLGEEADAVGFGSKADEIRTSYNREFFNPETGDYASGSQTCQLVSLCFGLVHEDKRDMVRRRLAERIAKDDYHLTTGFVGTPLLLTGLVDFGFPELAWAVATRTNHPGFIDAILNRGNTVMKEDWNGGLVQMPSLQGPIGAYFFHSLAGIQRDPSAPGYKHIVIRPETANSLQWVRARLTTLHGRVESAWRRVGGVLTMDVVIPPNTTASVHVPASSAEAVREGNKPASKAPGLRFLSYEAGRAIFSAQPGAYLFEAR